MKDDMQGRCFYEATTTVRGDVTHEMVVAVRAPPLSTTAAIGHSGVDPCALGSV